jgi:serine/threonine-protein kinase ATR
VTEVPTQGRALESIIEYFSDSNSLTQAWAYCQVCCYFVVRSLLKMFRQLLELAKYHSKGPFALISPHLSAVSRYVVSRIDKNPHALTEICRFLCRTVADFLTISLEFTVPTLVSSRSEDALEAMANLLEKPVGTILLPIMAKTLSDILILPVDKEFSKACDFLTGILAQDSVRFDTLLNSHRIEVVAELFITLAHDSDSGIVSFETT